MSIKNFRFILIDAKGFNRETDRSDVALRDTLSSEGKTVTKHVTMKCDEYMREKGTVLPGPSYSH